VGGPAGLILELKREEAMAGLAGLFGTLAIVALISAIPLSYEVEKRSGAGDAPWWRRGKTNVLAVALNIGVARDEETQKLRRKVAWRMLLVAAFMAMLAALAMSDGSVAR
jgi:hypothetical protein